MMQDMVRIGGVPETQSENKRINLNLQRIEPLGGGRYKVKVAQVNVDLKR